MTIAYITEVAQLGFELRGVIVARTRSMPAAAQAFPECGGWLVWKSEDK